MGAETAAADRAGWLDRLSKVFDRDTFARLDRLGVRDGWTALDVGTGAGSVANWLAARVGPNGHVVATDIEPRHAVTAAPNVDVLRHDVLTDHFPAGSFDVIHCRAVLVHLDDPDLALRRMAEWLKPGGVLLAQEPWTDGGLLPADTVADHVVRALGRTTLDGAFARRLPDALRAAGFEGVDADQSRESVVGGSELASFFRHTLAGAAVPLVANAELRRGEVASLLARFEDPAWRGQGWPRIAATGRRPV